MLIGSGLQALATSGKFKPVDFGQIRTAGDKYLYVDLGNTTCGGACGFPGGNNVDFTTNVVRAGVNFRF